MYGKAHNWYTTTTKMFYYLPIPEIHGIQSYQGRHPKGAVLSGSTSDRDCQKSGLTGIYVRKEDSSATRVFILKEQSYQG